VTDAPVHIVMEDGTELAVDGRLLFSDLSVDPTSGQVTLRAEVPNVDGTLLPGLYVRGRLPQYAVDQAMLVPQQAVTRSAQADTLMVVGPENKPVPRTVKIGGAQGTQWVVLEGLKPGERVIVDGFQKMRPGAPVKPVKWTGAGAASAPTGAAPASGAGR
ncbi:MAG TPA: efflux RND transporter periplasmic adaptor subunit, partial [Burkholderiaceae bacterium]|nr:efflux RND transporter periplasmic adaptor subunit [Burkholderiaceae bacterium]